MGVLHDMAPGASPKLNLAGDCALVIVASIWATSGDHATPWLSAGLTAALALAAWLGASRALHQYHLSKSQGLIEDLALTLVIVVGVTAIAWVPGAIVPEHVAPLALGRFLVVLGAGALWLRAIMPGVTAAADTPLDVLVLGAGPLARHTGIQIREERSHRKVFGYLAFDDEPVDRRLDAPVLGHVSDLERVLGERTVDEVYLAGNVRRMSEAMQEAVQICERFGVPFALPATPFRFDRARPVNMKAIPDGYVHYLSVENKRVQRVVKRVFDILVSSVALALLSPLLVVVAVLVKVTSRGPVLFKQERVGLHGHLFNMLKFRSMVANAEALRAGLEAKNEQDGPVFKITHDPRITPVGRVIRKLSIDELPQLLNVLRSEMSLVGPRPPLASEVARYEPWQRRRLSVRPGITCEWQVSGRSETSFETWMYQDMHYIDHWSLLQDLKLLLRTLPAVLSSRGAS